MLEWRPALLLEGSKGDEHEDSKNEVRSRAGFHGLTAVDVGKRMRGGRAGEDQIQTSPAASVRTRERGNAERTQNEPSSIHAIFFWVPGYLHVAPSAENVLHSCANIHPSLSSVMVVDLLPIPDVRRTTSDTHTRIKEEERLGSFRVVTRSRDYPLPPFLPPSPNLPPSRLLSALLTL